MPYYDGDVLYDADIPYNEGGYAEIQPDKEPEEVEITNG